MNDRRLSEPGVRRWASALRTGVAAAASLGLALTLAPSAGAAPGGNAPWRHGTPSFALAPFGIAVNHQSLYVADGFTGTVTRNTPQGGSDVVAEIPEVSGVDVSPDGRSMAIVSGGGFGGTAYITIRTQGRDDVVVDLSAYEAAHNPDAAVTYGWVPTNNPCAAAVFSGFLGGPPTYNGMVDTHPYAVTWLGGGAWAIADAGANGVLRVEADGSVSVVGLLPPQPVTITAEMAAALGAPGCIAGETFRFEPVPTDVEKAANGQLLVSSLPGGPEGPELGARGSVYSMSPSTGTATRAADGFAGAVDLASAPDGTLYVAELFGGGATAIKGAKRWTAYATERALSVEVLGGYLYVGTLLDIFGGSGAPGSVVRVSR